MVWLNINHCSHIPCKVLTTQHDLDNGVHIFINKKGHTGCIGIVEKAKETSSDSGMHNRAITVLHEQWMYPGMQRHTHITLVTI